jgi:hypothetical protein
MRTRMRGIQFSRKDPTHLNTRHNGARATPSESVAAGTDFESPAALARPRQRSRCNLSLPARTRSAVLRLARASESSPALAVTVTVGNSD